ncbi:hypothetical protein GCM10009611_19230 [Arthrobacter roseus]
MLPCEFYSVHVAAVMALVVVEAVAGAVVALEGVPLEGPAVQCRQSPERQDAQDDLLWHMVQLIEMPLTAPA